MKLKFYASELFALLGYAKFAQREISTKFENVIVRIDPNLLTQKKVKGIAKVKKFIKKNDKKTVKTIIADTRAKSNESNKSSSSNELDSNSIMNPITLVPNIAEDSKKIYSEVIDFVEDNEREEFKMEVEKITTITNAEEKKKAIGGLVENTALNVDEAAVTELASIITDTANTESVDARTTTFFKSVELEDKDRIMQHYEKKVNTTLGNNFETDVHALYTSKTGWTILDPNSLYNIKNFETPNGNKYSISGRADGRVKLPNGQWRTVEIKNRVKGFHNCIRDYEKVQANLYTYMFGTEDIDHVECYNGNVQIHTMKFDEEFHKTFTDRMNFFVDYVFAFCKNEEKIQKYNQMGFDERNTWLCFELQFDAYGRQYWQKRYAAKNRRYNRFNQ